MLCKTYFLRRGILEKRNFRNLRLQTQLTRKYLHRHANIHFSPLDKYHGGVQVRLVSPKTEGRQGSMLQYKLSLKKDAMRWWVNFFFSSN